MFIALTFWLIPETKGVTLEQIERNLMSGLPLREIGNKASPDQVATSAGPNMKEASRERAIS